MKREFRKGKIVMLLFAAVLAMTGAGAAGKGAFGCPVYGGELFTDGDTELMNAQAVNQEEQNAGAESEPTMAPEPTAVPEPTGVPEPAPSPGVSVNIENLNVYPNGNTENTSDDSGLFTDGSDQPGIGQPEENTGAEAGGTGSGGYSGGYSEGGGSSAQKEELIRQPKLLLESFNLSGQALKAGEEAKMKLVFQNKSASQGIYNLKVSLGTESSDLTLGQKSFYFSKVAAGGTITLTEQIKIAADAKGGPIPIGITFEYEDVKGTAVTGTESAEIRAVQKVQAVLECDELPVLVYSTDTVTLNARVQNLSRTEIYNVKVAMEGSGLFPREEIFAGNMEAGTEAEGNMRIYVGTRTMTAIGQDEGTQDSEMYGPVEGTITLSYEDALGNTYQEVKKYRTEIRKPEIKTLKVEAPKEANSWWYSVLAVGGAGMLVMILGLLMRLRKQRILLDEARREAAGEKA